MERKVESNRPPKTIISFHVPGWVVTPPLKCVLMMLKCWIMILKVAFASLAFVSWLMGFPRNLCELLYNNAPSNWPRFWELFGYCLPKKTRDKVYEPGRNELLEDYLLARKYRTKWARRWLTFCFTFRTALLIADCWVVLARDKAVKVLLGLIPWLLK